MRHTLIRPTLAALLLPLLLLLTSCEDSIVGSSVPTYPVNIKINTQLGMFVNFNSSNLYAYVIVDEQGYHFNGQTLPRTDFDAYGYAGVVVFISGGGRYNAYDLCCPNCLRRDQPCEIDGFFAVCPKCGEQYDLSSGLGTPTLGIAREPLRQYNTLFTGGIVIVRN